MAVATLLNAISIQGQLRDFHLRSRYIHSFLSDVSLKVLGKRWAQESCVLIRIGALLIGNHCLVGIVSSNFELQALPAAKHFL